MIFSFTYFWKNWLNFGNFLIFKGEQFHPWVVIFFFSVLPSFIKLLVLFKIFFSTEFWSQILFDIFLFYLFILSIYLYLFSCNAKWYVCIEKSILLDLFFTILSRRCLLSSWIFILSYINWWLLATYLALCIKFIYLDGESSSKGFLSIIYLMRFK